MKEINTFNNFKHFHYKNIDSTNNKAKELITKNSFFYVSSDFQKNGRGRLGNSWVSTEKSLYLSIVIPKSYFQLEHTLLSLISAITVHKLLKNIINSVDLKIKWPNDILFQEKKIIWHSNRIF